VGGGSSLKTRAPVRYFALGRHSMETVQGIGGVFFKAKNPKKLAAWYHKHLGVPVSWGVGGAFESKAKGETTAWSAFERKTTYLGPSRATFMINYRVRNLDRMLAQLRRARVKVDAKIDESEFGRFGWASDPEGNRFELWQPPAPKKRRR
jgi:predicted enzyme related to lactoylglutathione lyase